MTTDPWQDLKKLLVTTGLNPKRASMKAGLGETYVRDLITGRSKNPKHAELTKLAQAFGTSLDHLNSIIDAAKKGGSPPTFAPGSDVQLPSQQPVRELTRLPLDAKADVMGVVECGDDGEFAVNLTDGPIEQVDLPKSLIGVPEIFALFVAGESMAGLWMPGDVVFVSRKRPVTAGCYVVALVEAGKGEPPRAFLKQFVSQSSGRVKLRQFNPDRAIEIERDRITAMWRALHWREWAN